MRQPDVDPHGLSDAPERRRRRRLPYVVVGVVLVALVLFVWLHDRQTAQWENAQYGISLEFQNRFRNLATDEGPGWYPEGVLFENGFVLRNNPGWDEERELCNGFWIRVEQPPPELRGLPAGDLAEGQHGEYVPWAEVVTSSPSEITMVGERPAVKYTDGLEIDGVGWRSQTWLVPVGDLWYTVLLQARVSDWDTEAEALTEAAQSLRIAGGD